MSDNAGKVLSKADLISVTADIVAAYVANNSLPPAEVLDFIEGVHATFFRLQGDPAYSALPASGNTVAAQPSRPAVPRQLPVIARNPPNPVDSRTGRLLPLDFEDLVPDDEGFVFDPAWIDPDITPEAEPAVPVERSVKADSIVCLENGKELKVLKRHLESEFGLTPDAYRRRWGLTDDYPLVTHTFSTSRSAYAKKQGLGKNRAAS